MLLKNILLLLLFSFLSPRTTLGCSCVENFMSKPRRSTICDGFEREDNVLAVTVQTSYSKCFVYNSTVYDPFSCLKYEYADGVVTVTTQETFSCDETSPQYSYRHVYRPCGDVTAEITGSRGDYIIAMYGSKCISIIGGSLSEFGLLVLHLHTFCVYIKLCM